jgi:hypothetical protein
MKQKECSTGLLKRRAGFCFEFSFNSFFFWFLFSLVRWITHDDIWLMVTLEMALDEFLTFMEQDTDFLSYELGLVTEFGEI